MTNEYTDQDISLQDVLERVFSKLELPYDAERVAASIMAGVRNEIRAIVDEPTAAPEPPTFAVGTRVRELLTGQFGRITAIEPIKGEDADKYTIALDDGFNVTRRIFHIEDYSDSEPLPVAPAPALPEGVTPTEKSDPKPPYDYEYDGKGGYEELTASALPNGEVWITISEPGERQPILMDELEDLEEFYAWIGQAIAYKKAINTNGR